MHVHLELLAPAKNAEIGIAAIDCGADAVYIAGPAFGARQAAGNSVEEIAGLCRHAHQYGARIFVTLNTILYDEELEPAFSLLRQLAAAGVDAIIVQDSALVVLAEKAGGAASLGVAFHASTQCAIRTPEQARFLEKLGFSRIVLEREMSLKEIAAIRAAVGCEIEFFVHGALCVCYSGQCYLSECINGRSANRGACMQACRSRYDLVDAQGRILVRNKALLSLKDYKLIDRLQELAEAGICSFKIEGRLKNLSYVRNVVRAYSIALDKLCSQFPDRFSRASFGQVSKGFQPDLDKTFNRGYTELYLDGKRGRWSSMDAPKGMGEEIGKVASVRPLGREEMEISLKGTPAGLQLANGDGFSFYTDREIIGFRGDVCSGLKIRSKRIPELAPGIRLFRNLSVEFEKKLNASPCLRELRVDLELQTNCPDPDSGVLQMVTKARSEDGRTVFHTIETPEKAKDTERMSQLLRAQLSKKSGIYSFHLEGIPESDAGLPFLSAGAINAIRRSLADQLDRLPCQARPLARGRLQADAAREALPHQILTYKSNIANHLAEELMKSLGATEVAPAYELVHPAGAELMRTRYCIRYETGRCPHLQKAPESGPLFLVNNGRKFPLVFDCKHCEMVVMAPGESQK